MPRQIYAFSALAMVLAMPAEAKPKEEQLSTRTAPAVDIAGTLVMPAITRIQKVPLVILISGSGKQNRDASNVISGYAPHREWAEHLQKHGIATYRYDERGVGKSSGNWSAMTLSDHASDISEIIAQMKRKPEIDSNRIILMGHSEGSIISSIVAASRVPVAGVVLLAGPAWDLARVLDYQAVSNVTRGSMTDVEYAAAVGKAKTDLYSLVNRIPNLRSGFDAKPLALAAQIGVPMVIIQGALDTQVLPEQAAELAHAAVKGGNHDVTLRVFPELNHLLTSHPADVAAEEYERLPSKTLAASVKGFVTRWLVERFGQR